MSRGFWTIATFIAIAVSILYLGHYFLYFSLVRFFGIAGLASRTALAGVLLLLPASFIASSILVHRADNFFSRALYYCSALWLGLGFNLLLAFALAWGAWGMARFFLSPPAPAFFGWVAVVAACLEAIYGLWNAAHPRVRTLSVRIKNLPPTWRGRKVAQLSDVHLGCVWRAGFTSRLVAMVNAQSPDLVVITGDLFDGTDGELEKLIAPLRALRAPLGIYFVTGNHETYLGVERTYTALRTTPVKILADERLVIDGLQLIGIGYPEQGQSKDWPRAITDLPGFDSALPSILLYHGPTHITEAKQAGISLQLSGHAHHGQMFPLQFIPRLVYGPYYYGLHREGDYTLYTSGGARTWGPPLRTGNHPEITVFRLE